MQQHEPDQRAQLTAQLAAAGLDLDDARLDALAPVYVGLMSGVRRLNVLDLDETEPALVFRQPKAGERA